MIDMIFLPVMSFKNMNIYMNFSYNFTSGFSEDLEND